MRSCELCESPARMYCESDKASLCWSCDFKVHGANFLVARHSRTLLCHSCQSPTPWSATGAKLSPTFSVCEICSDDPAMDAEDSVFDVSESCEGHEINDGDALNLDDNDDDDDDDDDDDVHENENEDADEVNEEEEGENQVVPWSFTPPSPPATTSSSSEEELCNTVRESANWRRPFSVKRKRESSSDLLFLENLSHPIHRWGYNPPLITSYGDEILMPLKERRHDQVSLQGRTGVDPAACVNE